MSTNPETNGEEIPSSDAIFIIECLKHLNESKQVDISWVAAALKYSNIASAGNRFRALRKRYGFFNLECKNSSTPVKANKFSIHGKISEEALYADEGHNSATKLAIASPTKPPRGSTGRKGARASSKPISATDSMNIGKLTSPSKKPAAKRALKGKGIQIEIPLAVMDSVEIPVKKEVGIVKVEEEEEEEDLFKNEA